MASHTHTLVLVVSAFIGTSCTGIAVAGGLPASDMSGKGAGTFVRYTTATPVAAPSNPSKSGFSFYNAKEGPKGGNSVPLFQQARSLSQH